MAVPIKAIAKAAAQNMQGKGLLKKGLAGVLAIASAAKANKANKLETNTNLKAENQAVENAANAANVTNNAAYQGAANAMESNLQSQAQQNEAMNAIGGTTEEMALAQQQQANDTRAKVYGEFGGAAIDAFNETQKGVFNAQQNTANTQVNQLRQKSDNLMTSARNFYKSGEEAAKRAASKQTGGLGTGTGVNGNWFNAQDFMNNQVPAAGAADAAGAAKA